MRTAAKSAGRNSSPAQAWSRAIELTAPIASNPHRILSTVIEERAGQGGDAPALLSDGECLTYDGLAARANRYARWAVDHGIAAGDVVCLLMPNRPEYMAIWLGITRIGGVVALINTNLTGASLAHCINIPAPKHLIVAAELVPSLTTAWPDLAGAPTIWIHGASDSPFGRIDRAIERCGAGPLRDEERA